MAFNNFFPCCWVAALMEFPHLLKKVLLNFQRRLSNVRCFGHKPVIEGAANVA